MLYELPGHSLAPLKPRGSVAIRGERLAHACGLGWRRNEAPEVEELGCGHIVGQFEKLQVVSPKELSYAVAEPVAIVAQLLDNA